MGRDPALVELRRGELQLLRDDHQQRHAGVSRIEAELAGAAGDDDPHVAVRVSGRVAGRPGRLGELLIGEGDLEADTGGAAPEADEVSPHLDEVPARGAQSLVDAVAVEKAAIEDGDHRLRGIEGPPGRRQVDLDRHPRAPCLAPRSRHRSRQTRPSASAMIPKDIFEVPRWRSGKAIGTSRRAKPRRSQRNFISI